MEFSLRGVPDLPKKVTVEGRSYRLGRSCGGLGGEEVIPTIKFTSPGGLAIEILYHPVAWTEMFSDAMVLVEGKEVPLSDGVFSWFSDTIQLPNARLRALVEQAFSDLEAEELRLDPKSRHAHERQNEERRLAADHEQEELFKRL